MLQQPEALTEYAARHRGNHGKIVAGPKARGEESQHVDPEQGRRHSRFYAWVHLLTGPAG